MAALSKATFGLWGLHMMTPPAQGKIEGGVKIRSLCVNIEKIEALDVIVEPSSGL